MVRLAMGNTKMSSAVSFLSAYSQPDDGARDDIEVRNALARLIVMICEAARMSPPFNTVNADWGERDDVYISKRHVDYFWNWGDMSEALLRWKKDNYSDTYKLPNHLSKMLGTRSPSRALEIVYLLLNRPVNRPPLWNQQHERSLRAAGGSGGRRQEHQPPPSKRTRTNPAAGGPAGAGQGQGRQHLPPPNQGRGRSHSHRQLTPGPPGADDDDDDDVDYEVAHARPLVEIFAVRADGFHFLGTISVFDGRRGQTAQPWCMDVLSDCLVVTCRCRMQKSGTVHSRTIRTSTAEPKNCKILYANFIKLRLLC